MIETPRRSEQEPEDNREHIRGPDLDKAWHYGETFERDQDRRVDRGAQGHQHYHLGVPPHRKDFFHLSSFRY
jgi:hypothetical protein